MVRERVNGFDINFGRRMIESEAGLEVNLVKRKMKGA